MKTILALLMLLSPAVWAGCGIEGAHGHGGHDHGEHSHEGHDHKSMKMAEGGPAHAQDEHIGEFAEGLSDTQIAVVSVKGMVCDFCARGIEKTFKKDKAVQKVDVNLGKGIVLIAYKNSREISFDEIKEKIQANGQNAVDFQIIKI